MKAILIALAAAGTLASGAAAATTFQSGYDAAALRVQYPYSSYDRWDEHSAAIDEREAQINARIQRGLNDGRLTDHDARRLYRELRAIEAKERAFRSDGRLSGRETAELNRDLDRLAFDVRDQLRDEQRRDWR